MVPVPDLISARFLGGIFKAHGPAILDWLVSSATNHPETCAGRVAVGWSAMCVMGVGFKIFDTKVTPQPTWQQEKVQEGSSNQPIGSPYLLFVSWLNTVPIFKGSN